MTSSHFLYKFIYCTLYLIYYFIYLDYSLSCHLFRFFLLNQLIKPFDIFCLNFYNISDVFSQILINITHNDNFLKIYKYKNIPFPIIYALFLKSSLLLFKVPFKLQLEQAPNLSIVIYYL